MSHYHAVVWIDHQQASVWQFARESAQHTDVHTSAPHERVHSRKSAHGGHRAAADHAFFEDVVNSLTGAREILVIGPAQTKQEFVRYLGDKHPPIAKLVVAVESADHPSEGEILAHARRHFAALDRMLPQSGPNSP